MGQLKIRFLEQRNTFGYLYEECCAKPHISLKCRFCPKTQLSKRINFFLNNWKFLFLSKTDALPDSDYLSLLRYLSFFSVLGNRLLADNLSQLQSWSKICIFGHFRQNIGILAHFLLRFDSDKWDLTLEHLRTCVAKWDMSQIRAFLVSFFTQIWLRQIRFDPDMTQISEEKNGG